MSHPIKAVGCICTADYLHFPPTIFYGIYCSFSNLRITLPLNIILWTMLRSASSRRITRIFWTLILPLDFSSITDMPFLNLCSGVQLLIAKLMMSWSPDIEDEVDSSLRFQCIIHYSGLILWGIGDICSLCNSKRKVWVSKSKPGIGVLLNNSSSAVFFSAQWPIWCRIFLLNNGELYANLNFLIFSFIMTSSIFN